CHSCSSSREGSSPSSHRVRMRSANFSRASASSNRSMISSFVIPGLLAPCHRPCRWRPGVAPDLRHHFPCHKPLHVLDLSTRECECRGVSGGRGHEVCAADGSPHGGWPTCGGRRRKLPPSFSPETLR